MESLAFLADLFLDIRKPEYRCRCGHTACRTCETCDRRRFVSPPWTRTRTATPRRTDSGYCVPSFITLSVHLCLQHRCRDAARRAVSSATADTCLCALPGDKMYTVELELPADEAGDVLMVKHLAKEVCVETGVDSWNQVLSFKGWLINTRCSTFTVPMFRSCLCLYIT